MNQRTHSWIAVRAIALLDDEGESKNLVKLLKPHARMATVGAWIPDMADAKRGGSATDNHIFKVKPYAKRKDKDRFVTPKKVLIDRVGLRRHLARFIQADEVLPDTWWAKAYRGDVNRPGQHLPNRAMGMATMMMDLLLTGNKRVDALLPGTIAYLRFLDDNARTHEAAAAMHFFMLSHFLADICMPCHCDARKLSSYGGGFRKSKKGTRAPKKKPLHKEWEAHWSRQVGPAFEKKNLLDSSSNLTPRAVLQMARDVDDVFGLDFGAGSIPSLPKKTDVWLDCINLCRLSFAVISSVVPPSKYSYGNPNARATFDAVFGSDRQQLLKDLDRAIMHDAVLNTAIVWKHIWQKASK